MKRFNTRIAVLVAAVAAGTSCEDVITPKGGIDDGEDMPFVPTGGLPGSGGRFGTGGARASGGFGASGGVSTGSVPGAGGSPMATGGVPSTGGIAATGGSPPGFCLPELAGCIEDVYCCSGRCEDGICVACSTKRESCAELLCCDRTLPCTLDESNEIRCCRPLHDTCITSGECCSDYCLRGRCVGVIGSPCTGDTDCGQGTCSQSIPEQPGSCCRPKSQACLENSECCSGRCSSNSCG